MIFQKRRLCTLDLQSHHLPFLDTPAKSLISYRSGCCRSLFVACLIGKLR